jgi:FkbM family methyltransferase
MVTTWIHSCIDALLRRSVAAWVERQACVHLVQVGANDGIMADPVHEIAKQPNVLSYLVEPAPEVFTRLAGTYRAYANVTCVQVAVVPVGGVDTVEFFLFKPAPGLHWDDLYTGWSSTQRAHLEKFRAFVPDFDVLLTSERVPAITINELFRSTGWTGVDLLQVDVEGLDVALVGSIHFDRWAPRVMRFEHIHSDRAELAALLQALHTACYRTFSHGFDTVCIRESEMTAFRQLRWAQRLRPSWFAPPE